MKKVLLLILFLTLLGPLSFAQDHHPDSTKVTFYPIYFDTISLQAAHPLDTTTFRANQFDALDNNQTLYSTLSNTGLAHHPIRFNDRRPIGFDMSLDAFSQYIQTEKDLKTYLSLLPYSQIRYVMTTGDKEQHLNFKFGRQVFQGLFLSFEYNNDYSPGIYTNNKSNNNYFWVNALYTTQNQRYRALAYAFRNKIEVQENGGIQYDSVYTNHLESDNSAILTNLTKSTNYAKVSGVGFQHYFNLLPEQRKASPTPPDTLRPIVDSLTTLAYVNDTLAFLADSINVPNDSLVARKFTLGRINHRFAYQRNQLLFNETSASLPFYADCDTLLSTTTGDTTTVYALRNSLTWNSLGYRKYADDIPFYLYAGINYDFYKIRYYDYMEGITLDDQRHSQVMLHGGVIMNLFGLTRITGHAQLVTLGYQIGDFDLRGQWRQRFARQESNFLSELKLCFDIDVKRQSPTWFETRYHSNHFRWDNDFHPATFLSMDLRASYQSFSFGVKNTTINDLIYFNQEARPTQHDGMVSVREIYGSAAYSLWRFRMEGFFCLNMLSNSEVIHLPAFQSRLKLSYAQPIFKKAATLQPTVTLQYFTKYYADAYMPALRTFYLQDEVLVGNYPFIDFTLAINVKQADIFVQYSNMFLLTGNYDSFIAPHYPMRDSRIFIGVNCRLFN